MADVRCPMCGKTNPPTAETCASCGARLTPARADAKGEPPARPSTPPASGDWMSDLRVDILRNRPKTGMLPPEPEAPTDSGNWLSRLGPEDQQKSRPASRPEAEAEPIQPPDWLMRTRANAEPSSPAKNKPVPSEKRKSSAADESEEVNSLLDRLSAQQDDSVTSGVTGPQAGVEVPSWLSKVREQTSAANMAMPPASRPARQPPSSKSARQESKEQTPQPPKREEEPPWLKRIRTRKVTEDINPPAPEESEPAAEPSNELPDWLSKIREKSPDARTAAEQQSAQSMPLPQADRGGAGSTASPPESSLPDWLQKMDEPSAPPWAEPQKPPRSAPQGIPDWLSGAEPKATVPPSFGQTAPASTGAAPDWLAETAGAGLARSTPKGPAFNMEGQSASPFDQALSASENASLGLSGTDSAPGWDFPDAEVGPAFLGAAMPSAGMTSAFSAGTEPIVSPAGESEAPDWLESARHEATTSVPPSMKPEAAPEVEAGPSLQELLKEDSVPAWLSKPAEEQKPVETKGPLPEIQAPAPSEGGIEQAELPRWLEAMRPIQAVQVAEEEEHVESVGPLAGLRGVITAEPVVAMPRRPRILAGNIDATPQQTARAEMLQRMILETEWRGPHRAGPRSLWEPLVRRLIAAALLAAVSIAFGSSLFERPGAQSALPVAVSFADTINNLELKKPVLVAFDYDPSSAPEMEVGAGIAIAQLFKRGIPLVIISTEPTGPTLGEILLRQNGEKAAADFGYIPGGASGLRSLAEARDTNDAPDAFRSKIGISSDEWGTPSLVEMHSLADFSLFLVVAAKPQTIRDWVEQVHTGIPDVPMIAVTSAAADALVFPYTQASSLTSARPQLYGLVAGFAGAESYRAYAQSKQYLPDTSSPGIDYRWEAFGMSSGMAGLVLLFGMAASLAVLGMRGTQRNRDAKH